MLSFLFLTSLALAQSDPALISSMPDEAAAAEPPSVVVRDDGTIRLEGVPELDEALRGRLVRYQNTRSASLAAVSADGSEVLINTRFDEVQQVHHVAGPGAARTQLTFGEEPVAGATWVPGTTDLTYRSDVGGTEAYQIWRQAPGQQPTLLTDGTHRHSGFLWDDAGRQLAFVSNARNGTDQEVWLGDGVSPASNRVLVEGEGYWYPMDWSDDGTRLLVGHYLSRNLSELYIVDVASGERTRLDPIEHPGAYAEAVFAHHADLVYVITDARGEFRQLYEVDVALGAWRELTAEVPWNIDRIALSPDGRTLALVANVDAMDRLYLLDTRKRRLVHADWVPDGLIGQLRFPAANPRALFLTWSGPTAPGDVYRADLRRKRLQRWTHSELGPLEPATLVTPEAGRTSQGQVPYFLYRPAGEGPHPVVIQFHGGPESQARPRFSSTAQYLAAEAGIAVLVPNVRGSDGYGKAYLLADNGTERLNAVDDIAKLLDHVAQDPGLDEARVGVLGGSYGGYMVLAALTTYPDRILAGVDVVGISDFVTFLEHTKPYRRDLRRAEYGDERDPEVRAFLQEISPLAQADAIRSALLVAHGAGDPRVPVSEAEQVVQAVREQGQDVWYFLARNEGHGFRKKHNQDLYQLLMLQFFTTHLQ